MIRLYLFASAALIAGSAFSQQNTDCNRAIELRTGESYTAESPPSGTGRILEYQNNRNSLYFFEQEHHSAWYYFTIPDDGILSFEIIPHNPNDDYDFLLYEGKDLCKSIPKRSVRPVRGNIARNDLTIKSRTGLSASVSNEFAPPGPGPAYSKSISVKKGQTYSLVLDNVYPGGKGHTIELKLSKENMLKTIRLFNLHGTVTDNEGKPVKAKIVIEEDRTGELITELYSDSLGYYSVDLPAIPLNITAVPEGFLYSSENYKPGPDSISRIDFSLVPPRLGNSILFYNIHFAPNKSDLLPNSYPDLNRLVEFLKKYPQFIVEVQGHSNYNLFSDRTFLFQLSFERAKAVGLYLTENGIEQNRINIRGLGGSKPLVISDDIETAMRNLRVEVLIIDQLPVQPK